jgi:hypothetical protein
VSQPAAPSERQIPVAAPAPAAPPLSTTVDEEGEDTEVLTGVDQSTVEVRRRTHEEDDFFSNVDDRVGGNEFKW